MVQELKNGHSNIGCVKNDDSCDGVEEKIDTEDEDGDSETEKEEIGEDEDPDMDMDEKEEGQTKIDKYLSRVESSSDDFDHPSCYLPKKVSKRR